MEESAEQLEGKLNDMKTENEEEKLEMEQKILNVKDDLGKKIVKSSDDLCAAFNTKLEDSVNSLNAAMDEKIDTKLIDIKTNLDEMEKNVIDALESEKGDREKMADDTKMAFEEEKMLRAQDIGIIRLLSLLFLDANILEVVCCATHHSFSFQCSFLIIIVFL